MNNENVPNENLDTVSIDELVDLSIETDELIDDLDDIIKRCDAALNSQGEEEESWN